MKKYSILVLSILIISSICLFLLYEHHHDLNNVQIDCDSFVYEYSEQDLAKQLQMEKKWLKSYKVLASLSNLEWERILVFQVEDGYMERVKERVERYLSTLKESHADSLSQIEKHTQYYENEKFYIVIISKQASTIMKDIKERMQIE
ncbi:MAG: DUF4358 domain-containing protein [Erysipelotrichia bacterium]|nr:DUF4358 domain-containing protein [Erysipelotrichia bacterium]